MEQHVCWVCNGEGGFDDIEDGVYMFSACTMCGGSGWTEQRRSDADSEDEYCEVNGHTPDCSHSFRLAREWD